MVRKNTATKISLSKLAAAHFFYVAAFVITTVAIDSWALITPQAVLRRWTMAAVMLVVITAVWYLARNKPDKAKLGLVALILLDIAVATFVVYTERGMASRGVALYAIPIIMSATLANSSAIYAAASLCTASYALAAVRYFVVNFNEGYKIELYSTIGFYSAGFFILAYLVSTILRKTNN